LIPTHVIAVAWIAVLAATLASIVPAAAQTFPSRPVTIIVPYPAGGQSDTLVRIVAERMRVSLGQPVVIDNVSGATGRIGTLRLARAAPDGYTIGQGGAPTHVVSPAINTLNYDVIKDFEPVALLGYTAYVILARKAMPADNLQQLIAWLKANPDKASQGTTGIGSGTHLMGVFFQKRTGTRFAFVPYRGSATTDLIAGNIDLMIDPTSSALPLVRGGNARAYAVTDKARLAVAPDIPTVDEAGLPGFHFSNWFSLYAPKGTPRDIIATLNAAVVVSLADATVRARLANLGLEIYPREQLTPEALSAFQRAEIDRWWPIIRAAGIKEP
jgi:tripartite-type tricarboxylate transporter receptor subunit TctC